MGKGILIYKKQVEIEGLDKPFDMIIRFDKKSKLFSVTYPERIMKTNIIQTAEDYDESLRGIEEKFYNEVANFEMLQKKFVDVIVYQVDETWSYRDGSGQGFVFNWGVYRKIKPKNIDEQDLGSIQHRKQYHFIRGYKGAKNESNEYAFGSTDKDQLREIPWNQEAEDFFNGISQAIEKLHENLHNFLMKGIVPDFTDNLIPSLPPVPPQLGGQRNENILN